MMTQEQIEAWKEKEHKIAELCRANAAKETSIDKQQKWFELAENHDCTVNTLWFVLHPLA
jgi:hypothetical protein